jgi:hypothetical protein
MAVRAHGWTKEETIRGALLGHEGVEHKIPVNVYYDDILKLLAARRSGTWAAASAR